MARSDRDGDGRPGGGGEDTRAHSSGRALGLHVTASYVFSGLRGARGPDDGRSVRLELVSADEFDAAWSGDAMPIAAAHGAGVLIEHSDDAGYLVTAPGAGRHLVDPDGHRIRTATGGAPAERWQAVLAGHALPLAAVQQGLEVFKASAVVVAGQVMAFAGPVGAGKSALAAQLLLVGARFFADDLVALEVRGERIVAHAGVGVARLGSRGRAAVPALTAQGADVIGRDGKTLIELTRDVPTLPLRSLYLVSSVPEATDAAIAAELHDPLKLLACAHCRSVRTPERLRRQLELVGELSAQVGIFSVHLAPGAERELARAIFSHAALEVLQH